MTKSLLLITASFLILPFVVNAQWSGTTGNIYNTNGGNVGINTAGTTPISTLDVQGYSSTTLGGRTVMGDNGNYSPVLTHYRWTGSGTNYYQTTIGNSLNIVGALEFQTGAGGAAIGSDAQTTRMTILAGSGYIGINAPAPTANLTVGTIGGGTSGAQSSAFAINAGGLGTTAGNDIAAGSISFHAGNTVSLGVHGYRVSNGSDWTGTAIGLGMDVDNDTRVGANLWLNANGNVGIGVTNPGARLHVGLMPGGFISPVTYTYVNGDGLLFNSYGVNDGHYTRQSDIIANSGDNNTEGRLAFFTKAANSAPSQNVTILGNGSVGIGTPSPSSKLVVSGNAPTDGTYLTLDDQAASGRTGVRLRFQSLGIAHWNMGIPADVDAFTINGWGGATQPEYLRISSSGSVGIGTTTPDEKLAVNGTIHSQEVRVDLTGWEDRVFKPTYKLPSLSSVKSYIDLNHHLPDMPSEDEIVKNGLQLGDMEKTLAKKVEELTLYLLEKDTQLSNQQKELAELKAQVGLLMKRQ